MPAASLHSSNLIWGSPALSPPKPPPPPDVRCVALGGPVCPEGPAGGRLRRQRGRQQARHRRSLEPHRKGQRQHKLKQLRHGRKGAGGAAGAGQTSRAGAGTGAGQACVSPAGCCGWCQPSPACHLGLPTLCNAALTAPPQDCLHTTEPLLLPAPHQPVVVVAIPLPQLRVRQVRHEDEVAGNDAVQLQAGTGGGQAGRPAGAKGAGRGGR